MPRIHTIPIPEGWTIEQAWEAIRRGEKLPEKITTWANIEADENEHLANVIDHLKRGDTQIDLDGTEWWISGVTFQNGKPSYSRILVGSPAYKTMREIGIVQGDEGVREEGGSQEKHGI